MCIHRYPLGGRNFESFSEDPYLTGKLATAHVKVFSPGVLVLHRSILLVRNPCFLDEMPYHAGSGGLSTTYV